MKYIIVFENTNHAIKAETVLSRASIPIKIRPIPNEISVGCGISIAFDDIEIVEQTIKECNVKYRAIYELAEKEYKIILKEDVV